LVNVSIASCCRPTVTVCNRVCTLSFLDLTDMFHNNFTFSDLGSYHHPVTCCLGDIKLFKSSIRLTGFGALLWCSHSLVPHHVSPCFPSFIQQVTLSRSCGTAVTDLLCFELLLQTDESVCLDLHLRESFIYMLRGKTDVMRW